ncbi:UDP-glycosyltransferase 76C4 [Acorus calamus]|uniref:UDP-glycosyltransferase 76C4 n=1 Tax=Acorus calamus TaxID=4465 RepID=A0AAV9DLG6_ACOCL|nr:UDP-glycosyltransferase 76C4 [Acorus calamus]
MDPLKGFLGYVWNFIVFCLVFVLLFLLGLIKVFGVIGSVLVGLGYGVISPLMATFEAVGEGVENKFKKCFVDGTWISVLGGCTIVRDFSSLIQLYNSRTPPSDHPRKSRPEEIGEESSTTMNPYRSVILIPCPFQGHINPMFQLADLLHKKGFPIIIVHTTFNAPDLTTYPNFRFEKISENLTERETSTQDLMVLVDTLNTKCTPHFRDRLMKISEEGAPIGCIVADAIMHSTQSIADELGLTV